MTITGTTSADSLVGTGAANTFDGQGAPAGSHDYEQGNGGADTFVFKQGYGQLEVNEAEYQYGQTPTAATLQLGAGITAAQLLVTADSSGNVILTDGVSGDRVQIDGLMNLNYGGVAANGVAQVQFADRSVLTRDHIVALARIGAINFSLGAGKVTVNAQDGLKGQN